MTAGTARTDVIVAGGGAAGLMAAAAVVEHSGSLTVTVVEKDTRLGSSAEIGSGTVIAAGTRLQRQAGIDDSPEILAADIAAKSQGSNDQSVTSAVCQESAEVVHWLIDRVGVPLELATDIQRVGMSRLRAHAHPSRSGRPLIGALRHWVQRHPRITFIDQARVDHLVTDGARVVGIETSDGRTILGSAVVLATGGFGANKELVVKYLEVDRDLPYIGARGHTGDGLRCGRELGAALRHMAGFQGHGYYHPRSGTRINPGVIVAGGIMVNREGLRFEREDRGYSEWARYVNAQPGGVAFAIWDRRIDEMYAHSQTMADSHRAGVVVHAEDPRALAEKLGVPVEPLWNTIESYNAGVAAGADQLGRQVPTSPLGSPLLAAMVSGAIAQTLGGLQVDRRARVQRPDGSPIAGLYAAGMTAAGVSGEDPAGYLSGSGLLMAFGLGRIAGKDLAENLDPAGSRPGGCQGRSPTTSEMR